MNVNHDIICAHCKPIYCVALSNLIIPKKLTL